MKKRLLFGIIGICFVVLMIVTITQMEFCFAQETTIKQEDLAYTFGNTPNNINNYGVVAYDDEYIYYSTSNLGQLMKKSRYEDSEPIMIANPSCAQNLNVTDEFIFYSDEAEKIMRIRKDGSEQTMIYNHMMIDKLLIINDWIYCIGEDKLVRMRLDGSECETILDIPCDSILYKNKYLYCSVGYLQHFTDKSTVNLVFSRKGIWKININTLKKERIYNKVIYSPVIYKDTFYFSSWNNKEGGMCFYRMSMKTMKPIKVSNHFYQCINQYKNFVIVCIDNQILRMNYDGEGIVNLMEGYRAYIIDGTMYYSKLGSDVKFLKLSK